MTLQQLAYIVTVAKYSTITDAAQHLFISQPSLTNAIKELEKELNVTIFNRTNRGVSVTNEGKEVLSYARQILEQTNLMTEHFTNGKEHNTVFSVSCQHYSFAVNAFVDVIKEYGGNTYDFTLRETQTYEIIEDVSNSNSEVGVLFLSSKNQEVLKKFIRKNELIFHSLFIVKPHIFISSKHPLAKRDVVYLEELENYPYLSFEQGDYNSFYFSEEILSTIDRKKNIKVRDRATLFNLAVGLDGYTVSSGIINRELNGENIISKPLMVDEYMNIGFIHKKIGLLSRYANSYINALKKYTKY